MKQIVKRSLLSLLILFFLGLHPFWQDTAFSATTKTHIRVGVNCTLPPFQFLDQSGNPQGLHIDIMRQIAAKENLEVEYVIYTQNSAAVTDLKEGDIDAILGVSANEKLRNELYATRDISSASLCMLVDKSYITRILHPEMDSRRYIAAFEIDTISLSQLPELSTTYNIIVGNQQQLYNALMSKQVNAVIGVKESMLYLLEHQGGAGAYSIVHNYVSTVDYKILTRRSDRVLLNSFNRSITQLRASSDYEKLLNKWVGSIETEAMRQLTKKMMYGLFIAAGIVAVVVVNFAFINHKLKDLVAEKTKEIQSRIQQLEAESLLRSRLIEFSPGGILLLNADGTIQMMNSVAREISGLTGFDLEQSSYNIRDVDVFGELWEQIEPQELLDAERPFLVKQGQGPAPSRIFRLQCYSIGLNSSKVLMAEDITREEEEKKARFELQKNKSLSRVIAGMAHEIKNPLMSIRTFASLIPRQANDADFQSQFAQYVPQEVERINRLIEMLINYTRPSRTHRDKVPVDELMVECTYFAKVTSANRRIAFETQASTGACVFANRDQLKQALINLTLNSIQSIEEKLSLAGDSDLQSLTIRLSAYRLRGLIVLEVYDEGGGMDEAALEKCLDPFFTTKPDGLGMGLSLTNQFVQENGGRLEITSTKNQHTKICMLFEEDLTK